MAQIMDLTTSGPACSLVDREVKRRVWWTLFMGDRWCSSGHGLPRQIDDSNRAVDLPMDESLFHSLNPDQHTFGVAWSPGLWAHMITLVQLFGPIQDLNRRSAQGDVDADDVDRLVDELGGRLQLWHTMLPIDVKFSLENLRAHKARGIGGPFVALHLGFHHYSTLLYFQFLESRSPPAFRAQSYVERCKSHAASYSALLALARREGRCEAVYPTVGHMATVSSSVLLHTLLFGETDELPEARNGLNANFEALVELRNYWPSLASRVSCL